MEEIAGPWLDRRTGKTVMVRDAIMDGDEMVIISSIGQIPNDVFSNFFIRMSDEEYSAAGIAPEVSGNQLLSKINAGVDTDLQIAKTTEAPTITLDTPIGGPNEPPVKTTSSTTTEVKQDKPIEQTQTQNDKLIQKVFEKHNNEPTVNISIDINEWPVVQLKMLIDTFDVSFEEISRYIIKHYLNEEILIENFSEYLKTELEK